ncbi:family 1 glycosylhydrolase [Deinococcus arenicola]|uniref:Family 1 glycosylhydrolase n=1 Tax=Deinococcus arenicola TaxID=2994950 RepID=A0ABU4DRE3_9DEIO|nr:family 1 glycosylhydrolase [Deinococcus sp. ZS9-10]MDV6374997.1 family 1 glycosylhydrolase [Deinococcus sp. ZS9-10]
MDKGFLEIIKRDLGDGDYAGDQYGGAGGSSGAGLPTGTPSNFMFATGIECSYPTIEHGKVRRDQLAECHHYERWQEDLHLVKDLGLKYLRYGLPYHRIHQGPGQYDWEFADQVMAEMKRLEITPILDLMHFGVPDWLGNYQNPDLPVQFAAYAEAVAKRYPWVRHYTPVNEIYVTAKLSAQEGLWNEQLKSERGFVTALKHSVAANILACQSIARVRPDVIIIQAESAEYMHDACAQPRREISLQNRLRFLSLDLNYAVTPDAEVYLYLMDNGLSREEYDWFMAGEPPGHQIMGIDYYGHNEKIIKPDGSMLIGEDVFGWYQIVRGYYERYKKPVFHTETNTADLEQAPVWLWKQWLNILRMRQEGIPVLGFTWYSLTDQMDWDIAMAEKRGKVTTNGLYNLDRQPNPVAHAYRELLENFGQITVSPHSELLEITDQAARLKMKV